MCCQLFQKYACNCDKLICTTACPHALGTADQIPSRRPPISRSSSTVSSIATSIRRSQTLTSLRNKDGSSSALVPVCDIYGVPEPKYCVPPHLTRHYTQQSLEPCINCYMLPEFADRPRRLVEWYRREHPLEWKDDHEEKSGVTALREKQAAKEREIEKGREGLLNVFVHGDINAGRVVNGNV